MKHFFLFIPLLFADCISSMSLERKVCVEQPPKKEVKLKTIAKAKPVAKPKPDISFTLFINM